MNISGDYSFDANQETVWATLMNTDAIAHALPGVDNLVPVEGEADTWAATAKIGIGMVSGTFSGKISMSEQEPPNQYRLTVSGEGQQSLINGSAVIKLRYDESNQKTFLTWDAEAQISGKLAGIGQRVYKAAAKTMSKQFFKGLASQIPAE